MQITVKSSKIAKTGESKKGPWTLIVVVAEETGIEYTTFDKVADVPPGTILEIDEPDIKEGKHSFKKCEIVSRPQVTDGNDSTVSHYKRDTEGIEFEYRLKAQLQEKQLWSDEAVAAYNGIMELAGKHEAPISGKFADAFDKALTWAGSRFDVREVLTIEKPTIIIKPVVPAASELTGQPIEGEPDAFPNIGALLQWCADKGISRVKFMEILKVTMRDLPKLNVVDAHQAVLDYLKECPVETKA